MNVFTSVIPLILLIGLDSPSTNIQRFPPPDFDSGYKLPDIQTPFPRADWLNFLDVGLLLVTLSLCSYLVFKKRSRRGVFILTIFSLIYFGFIRKGCVCSIGAIQNVTLAFFDKAYVIPLTVTAFFLLPLIFTLFFGRVFCAGVCPLGAIQDLVLIKPIKIPDWLQHALGLLAYLYLGAAVLFAATGSAFIICEYDPFIAFFRLSGKMSLVILGTIMLGISLFVGRPYCLFLCPYGVLLRFLSQLSRWRITISPDMCVQCGFCEDACPFGAIIPPTPKEMSAPNTGDRKRLILLLMLTPIFIALGGWSFSYTAPTFSRMHSTVRLAEQIALEDSTKVEVFTDTSKTFRDTGQSKEVLYQEARILREKFYWGGWILGGFIGLVLTGKLISLSVFRTRVDYEIDQAGCLACGRCFSYCPIEIKRQKKIKSASSVPKHPVTIDP